MASGKNKAIKTLSRRLEYLENRRDMLGSYNEFDKAEMMALRYAIKVLRNIKDEQFH